MLKLLLDALYPSQCGICGLLGDRPICAVCEAGFEPSDLTVQSPKWRGALDGVARLYKYEGRAEQAVRRLKFSRATVLAEPMSRRLESFASDLGLTSAEIVMPVPIHWTRRFHRGFNQSQLLCGAFPQDNVTHQALRRVRATRPQVGLTPEQRRLNLSGAFRASDEVMNRSVLLVDDVITTGHTVGECARALKDAGATQVWAVAFCGS